MGRIVYLTRKTTFNAAHRLARPDWSDEQNEQTFGKCANKNWHGHNYTLYVTIKGEVREDTGFVMDLKVLKAIIEDHVAEEIDHRNLNLDVPMMEGKLASTENLAIAIWEVLVPLLQPYNVQLHKVRLDETDNNYVEYYGDANAG